MHVHTATVTLIHGAFCRKQKLQRKLQRSPRNEELEAFAEVIQIVLLYSYSIVCCFLCAVVDTDIQFHWQTVQAFDMAVDLLIL